MRISDWSSDVCSSDLLKHEQQSGALVALRQVDEALRQAVLDEWEARCCNSSVRNPAGYLFGIIQTAIRGEFKAWAGDSATVPPASRPPAPAPAPSAPPVSPAVARAQLARLRAARRAPLPAEQSTTDARFVGKVGG